jgi:predicted phosphatase
VDKGGEGCFVSLKPDRLLALLSAIHVAMADKKLYEKMTMKQLLRRISKHRVQKIGGERIIFPITKAQREIFEAFGLDVPV